MDDGAQLRLVVADGGSTFWHCAIHGTTDHCPFRWMSCEETDTPEAYEPERAHRPWLDNEEDEWERPS